MTMKKLKTRFGEVEYDPQNTISFPEGLVGFETLHKFIVMPNQKEGPLFWIQSTEDPAVAFVLTDPTNFFPDYQVIPDETERKKIGLTRKDRCFTLAVVTVPPDRKVTLNLSAPILYNPGKNKAIQIIIEDSKLSSRQPLPSI